MRPCLFKKYRIAALMTIIITVIAAAVFSCDDGDDDSERKGAATPWPEWVFHHFLLFDGAGQNELTQLVDDYLANNIQVGAVTINSGWETGINTFEFDPVLYPDPQGMVDYLHDQGVRVLLWINPAINAICKPGDTICPEADLYNEALANNYLMGYGTLIPWLGCPGGELFCAGLVDIFNPEALAWYHSVMDPVIDLGIDGWKCDTIEPFSLAASISPYAGPTEPWELNDAYYADFFQYIRTKLGPDRVIMARPVEAFDLSGLFGQPLILSFMHADQGINFLGWVGEQGSNFAGLQTPITNMYLSAEVGYLSMGSDIGGKGGPGRELFIRWAQLGAVSPFMENGAGGEHRPWMIGGNTIDRTETADIYRTYVNLNYKLIPYINNLAKGAWARKESPVQPRENGGDMWTWEYLLGTDILVAPIYEAGGARTVNFPAGSDWVYLWDRGQEFTGGAQAALTFPLAEYPVFLRKGSPVERDPDLP
jgi:alpha-D-xyloside xylohydrolase